MPTKRLSNREAAALKWYAADIRVRCYRPFGVGNATLHKVRQLGYISNGTLTDAGRAALAEHKEAADD